MTVLGPAQMPAAIMMDFDLVVMTPAVTLFLRLRRCDRRRKGKPERCGSSKSEQDLAHVFLLGFIGVNAHRIDTFQLSARHPDAA